MYALTSMMKLALGVVHLESLEDSFTLIHLKVRITLELVQSYRDNELSFPLFPLLVSHVIDVQKVFIFKHLLLMG